MFDELNAAFPGHSHFYEVIGITLSDALERCARLTGDEGHVFQYKSKIVFAVKHDLGNEIDWLTPVEGTPVDVDVTEV
jgi:hypothetical protein